MANTYTQLSVHAVFAVSNRECLITKEWRDDLHEYTTGIIRKLDCKPQAVGGWLDHINVFAGFPAKLPISELIQKIKCNSSLWINEKGIFKRKFSWQDGYGAFTYAKSQRDTVIKYIKNQEARHKKQTFRQEYITLLKNFEIEYAENYLFDFFDWLKPAVHFLYLTSGQVKDFSKSYTRDIVFTIGVNPQHSSVPSH